jgi:hypothetical protein
MGSGHPRDCLDLRLFSLRAPFVEHGVGVGFEAQSVPGPAPKGGDVMSDQRAAPGG